MSLTFHIKGWQTVPAGQCPCDTCDFAVRVRGHSQKHDLRLCRRMAKEELPFEPVECTGWTQKGDQPLYKLEQLAWNLLEDKRGNLIGFRSPSKTRELVSEGKIERPDSVDPDF